MKFKQLSIAEFRQDSLGAYDINSSGFRLALLGATGEIPALELCASDGLHGTGNHWPFSIDQLTITQERPCSKIIEHFDLARLYENSTAQQSQELALDPIYVADYSLDAPKPKIQQLDWAPSNTADPNVDPTMAVLTSYGSCQIRKKTATSRQWNHVTCNLNKLYLQHVFPFDLTYLQKVCDLKTFKDVVDLQCITAFAWHSSKQVFYTANAVGWVVAFRYETTLLNDMSIYFKLHTNLGRITYMRAFDDFLLIANCAGVVKVFKLNSDDDAVSTMSEVECLWSKQDRMACRKAEANYSKDSNSYYLIFSKAANILGYQLGTDGCILSSCVFYVGGVKITGIETLCCNEFIITMINGVVKHLKLEINDSNELKINERILATDLDIKNHQILGVVATPNKNLWAFVLYRIRDYLHQSKYTQATSFLSICKLTSINSLQMLANLNVKVMNPFLDYAVALRLDIVNNISHEDYNNYYELKIARFPRELNDAFLQKLQLKLLLVKSQIIFEGETYKNIQNSTNIHLDFLLGSVQATYIICRMQQLQHNIGRKTPTVFQNLVGSCLKRQFDVVIRNLQALISDESDIKDTTERFVTFAAETFKKLPTTFQSSEKCLLCWNEIDENKMICPSGHNVRRCCVSYVQVPFFNRRFCAQCNVVALDNDTQLLEILGPDEVLKCTFCRFSFLKDCLY